MATFLRVLMALVVLAAAPRARANSTIVMIRHGEKPAAGLGQLDCQGLNRALALPAVIARQFGKPDLIFAPDPGEQKDDGGKLYDYVRPLATVEPTAIAFGLPVDASIGVSRTDMLQALLAKSSGLVLVAWEHHGIVDLARGLMTAFHGDPRQVPKWDGDDFDGIYVLRITPPSIAFERRTEGLAGLSKSCPGQ